MMMNTSDPEPSMQPSEAYKLSYDIATGCLQVRQYLMEGKRQGVTQQAIINITEEALWNLMSACSNTGKPWTPDQYACLLACFHVWYLPASRVLGFDNTCFSTCCSRSTASILSLDSKQSQHKPTYHIGNGCGSRGAC